MDSEQRSAYDTTRDFTRKGFRAGCYAPFTSMYLDPAGDARVCCQNVDHVLGNVGRESLLDIWRGEKADALRRAVLDYDLGLGCRFCQWQFDDGNFETALARDFDELEVGTPEVAWPQRLEFAISNTCNLECVMCDGDLSSRIRARREGRPPLPRVYDDAFFEDLTLFLPHLVEARFLGGEPFLARETFRVWDLMIGAGLRTPCKVTTNGTQWNERVERVLDHFPVSIALSLDGVTADTVEAIRVGADHGALMANLGRFRSYTLARGTLLELTFCLMQQNWREFGDYLLLGDAWGAEVSVNTVIRAPFSLYQQPLADFEEMVAVLEGRDDDLRARLGLNRRVWVAELDRLRHWRDQSRAESATRAAQGTSTEIRPRTLYFQEGRDDDHRSPGPSAADSVAADPGEADAADPADAGSAESGDGIAPLPPELTTLAADAMPAPSPTQAIERAQAGMPDSEVIILTCDADDVVTEIGPGAEFGGLPASACIGESYRTVAERVRPNLGEEVTMMHEEIDELGVFRRMTFRTPGGPTTYVQVCAFPVPWTGGTRPGSVTVMAASATTPSWANHTNRH